MDREDVLDGYGIDIVGRSVVGRGMVHLVGVDVVSAKLEPSEAQRKAMITYLSTPVHDFDSLVKPDYGGWLDALIAAANSIPEGAPVGTIARRPDGAAVAIRVQGDRDELWGLSYWSYEPLYDSELYADEPTDADEADSWPVIFTPGEAVGSGPTTDGVETYDPTAQQEPAASIDAKHLMRQREFSLNTFGPGARTSGVLDHIAKELNEIREAPEDISEWVDVIILAFDGAWRAGWEPQQIIDAIIEKQGKNEKRKWPDWRTADPDKAIEHVRLCEHTFGEAVRKCERPTGHEGNHGTISGLEWLPGYSNEDRDPKSSRTPRVLPSLGCEEARDGTVWVSEHPRHTDYAWRFWYDEDGWRTDTGKRTDSYPVWVDSALTTCGPYTEVLPDVG